MIRTLRRWHRRWILLLALLLPLLVALALAARQSVPPIDGLPGDSQGAEGST